MIISIDHEKHVTIQHLIDKIFQQTINEIPKN